MKTDYSNSANYKKDDRVAYKGEAWSYKPKKNSDTSTGKEPSVKNEWVKDEDKQVD